MGIGHWTVDGERERGRQRERERQKERKKKRKKKRKKEKREGEREKKLIIIRYLQGQTPDGMNRFFLPFEYCTGIS